MEEIKDKETEEELEKPSVSNNFPKVLDSILDFFSSDDLTKSISNAIDSWSKNKKDTTKYQFRLANFGLTFSLMVLVAIGLFGYFHIISKDVTGSLLGALIGYWYGQQKQNKK